MKNKGAVMFFTIAFAAVCLFQLAFTWKANSLDNDAEKYAHGDILKKRHYIDSIGNNHVFLQYNYMDVKERSLNLGLDLRGGMHVTLQVNMNDLLKQLSGNNLDPTFNQAIANANKARTTSQRNYIDLFNEELIKLNPNFKLATIFGTMDNKGKVDINSTNDQVIKFLKAQSSETLDRIDLILGQRIDKFGVTQPNKQKDEVTGRIIVELPGADDPERVRRYLKGSAKLEFFETYRLGEIYPFLQAADAALYAKMEADKLLKGDTTGKKTESTIPAAGTGNNNLPKAGEPKAEIAKAGTPADTTKKADTTNKSGSLAKAAKKDTSKQKEIPLTGITLPGIQQIYGQRAGEQPMLALVRKADTAKVNALFRRPEVKAELPSELMMLWDAKPMQGTDLFRLYALRSTGLPGKEAVLTGDVIVNASKETDRNSGSFQVQMQMNSEGAQEWGKITLANKNRCVAIVLDSQVYSAPNVENQITGGVSQITGNFDAKEAGDLANILQAGRLPVGLEIIQEAIVGPSMGQDAIHKGLISLAIGLVAILFFMIIYYNKSGWVANIALFVNLFFIAGVLASLGAALTLPGMAGILLTLATAVDANVLIYERIRDELHEGKGLKLAISEGFKHAMSSIIDANVVSLLIGIILLTFGSGPVKGFAIVLVIGILTSLFTSILVTRIMFEWLMDRDSHISFGSAFSNKMLRGINYDFVGKRKTFYALSGIIILIGIGSLAVRGLNYGVDFKGGYSYVVTFHGTPSIPDIRQNLTKTFGDAPEVKTYSNDTTLNIITDYRVAETGDNVSKEVKEKLIGGLAFMGKSFNPRVIGEQKVGSTIANDLKTSAFYSILFSLVVIFIYIIIRFRSWQFALGATVAMAHDALFVLTIFSLFKDIMPFSLDVDQAIIAAILTVMVYSMNDTVVVFDRIREYLNNNKKSPMIPTINDAINKTLSRTVITSFTIFLVVLILFIFGGEVIKGFAFAMLMGVLIGTYSSIFVATPIVVDLTKKNPAA